jgi:hypothetical protein
MRANKSKPKGFIAIISLLIIATISMTIAMTILKDGVDNASLSLSSIYYENARINASICLEDVLLRIKLENQFSTNLNYNLGTNQNCSTNIQWYTPQQIAPGITETLADLTVTGTSSNFVRTFSYGLKIDTHDVNFLDGSIMHTNIIDITGIDETNS